MFVGKEDKNKEKKKKNWYVEKINLNKKTILNFYNWRVPMVPPQWRFNRNIWTFLKQAAW